MTLRERLWRMVLELAGGILFIAVCIGGFRLALWLWLPDVSEPTPTIVRRSGTIGALLLGYALARQWITRRPPSDLVPSAGPALAGLVSGAALIGVPVAAMYALGLYRVTAHGPLGGIAGVATIIFGAALFEEVVFRGVVFRAAEACFGTVIALLAQSSVFSVLHVFNGNFDGVSIISGVVLGALWTLIYVLTDSLWAATLNHAAWNFCIFLTGLPLSGLHEWRTIAPLRSEDVGPRLLTGGPEGPEGSVIVLAVATIAVFALGRRAYVRGQVVPATGPDHHGQHVTTSRRFEG